MTKTNKYNSILFIVLSTGVLILILGLSLLDLSGSKINDRIDKVGDLPDSIQDFDDNTDQSFRLEDEKQRVTIIPEESNLINWQGRLLDHKSMPVQNATIRLTYCSVKETVYDKITRHSTHPSDKGSFYFNRLTIGTYNIEIFIKTQNDFSVGYFEWGDITFERNGLHEKDILLPGKASLVSGVVVDKETGFPFTKETIELWKTDSSILNSNRAVVFAQDSKNLKTIADIFVDLNDGTFRFIGLPESRYNITLGLGAGYYMATIEGVDVNQGQIRDDLRFQVPTMGILDVVLHGFTKNEIKNDVRTGYIMIKASPGSSNI